MSKWNEYGFPDLSGVHFQTALQGLTCAVMERRKAIFGDEDYGVSDQIKDFYEDEKSYCYPIPEITKSIDHIFAHLYYYVLPDGSLFSLENAANYLKEDLIDLALRFDGEWPYPNSALKYDWCMQRYRFINLAWKTDYSLQTIESIDEESDGSGETYWDAVDNLKRTKYDNDFYVSFAMSLYTEWSKNTVYKDYYGVFRNLRIPNRVRYKLSAPGLVCLEITPRMTHLNSSGVNIPETALEFSIEQGDTFRQWKADDFGCGFKFNIPQVIFKQYIPDGTIPGTMVELTGLHKYLSSLGEAASFPVPKSGYNSGTITRGFYADSSCYTDLRETFQFYDEIKVE